jgi:predicted phosphoribosyltransferase
MMFRDRREAGRKLAEKLETYRSQNPLILAIPRGGVPIGCELSACSAFGLIIPQLPIPCLEAGFGMSPDGTVV